MQTSNRQILENKRMRIEDDRPHFFKIIRGEDVKKHLVIPLFLIIWIFACDPTMGLFYLLVLWSFMTLQRIPPAFIKHLAGDISDRATLTCSSGGHWGVTVSKNPNGTYLEDGWKEFLRENNLGDDEFLVFIYDGDMRFHVKIFEKNGVKRSAPISDNPTEEETGASSGKRSRGRPRKYPVGSLQGPVESSRTQKTRSFTSKFPYFECLMTKSCVEKCFLLVGIFSKWFFFLLNHQKLIFCKMPTFILKKTCSCLRFSQMYGKRNILFMSSLLIRCFSCRPFPKPSLSHTFPQQSWRLSSGTHQGKLGKWTASTMQKDIPCLEGGVPLYVKTVSSKVAPADLSLLKKM